MLMASDLIPDGDALQGRCFVTMLYVGDCLYQVGLFKLGGEVFAYFLVDKTGRRPLFLASSSLVTVLLVILGKFTKFAQIHTARTDLTVRTV